MRKSLLGYLTIAMMLFLIAPTIISHAWSNAGFVELNNRSSAGENFIAGDLFDSFLLAAQLSPSNTASHRGLGYLKFAQGELSDSHTELTHSGYSSKDFILFAAKANQKDLLLAARDWLLIAELSEPQSPELWHMAGKICQKEPQLGSLCSRFLQNNDQNWLVNSTLVFDKDGWQTRIVDEYDLHYNIESCSGKDGLCAVMSTGGVAPEQGISWSQCTKLNPGQSYLFSSWIKADVDPDSEWRPVYIQGSVDGLPKGMWPGTQTGSSGWILWEQEFIMPEFDHNQACFYPARLMDTGKITFTQPKLTSAE